MSDIFYLLLSLGFILFAAHFFCNALEHLGAELKLSENVVGSIFAAVATALPETVIPILSIIGISQSNLNQSISMASIIGAPFMLSTISISIMAFAVLKSRGLYGRIQPNSLGLNRDLSFFLLAYTVAFAALFLQHNSYTKLTNIIFGISLVLMYAIYIWCTIKSSTNLPNNKENDNNQHIKKDTPLFITHLRGIRLYKHIKTAILLQLIIGLGMLIYFAHIFIVQINIIAYEYELSSFLLSLIIIPLATELPEKINSVLWIRRKRDTLAVGNITGAMVFQGTLLPTISILSGTWNIDNNKHAIFVIIVTMIASLWLLYNNKKQNIQIWQFIVNFVLYFIVILLSFIFMT